MKSKQLSEHAAVLAKGGKGSSNKMHKQQSASPARPAHTGKVPGAVPGAKSAKGGTTKLAHTTSVPVKPGQTGSAVGRGKGR
jgi:hypothetical protein